MDYLGLFKRYNVLFGLILFDLIIQFFVSYSMLFVERYGYETGIPFGFTAESVFLILF